MKPTKTARSGRPREVELGGRILKITLRLLSKSGFHGLNLDDVAAQCGTSKQALYRRWPTKSHLIAAAVVEGLARANREIPDSGSALDGLAQELGNAIDAWQATPLGGALRALIGERHNKQLAACLRKADSERREMLRAILRRAEQRHEIQPLAEIEMAIDTLLGGAWMRYLMQGRVPPDFARKVVAAWFHGAR